jgi:hypothetical protein
MSKCSVCAQEISFGPHPKSGKLTPLNPDGSIHFLTCSRKKETSYTAVTDLKKLSCASCGAPYLGHAWCWLNEEMIRLRAFYKCGHQGQMITETEENIKSITHNELDLHVERQVYSKYSVASYIDRVKKLGEAKYADHLWVTLVSEEQVKMLFEKGFTELRGCDVENDRERTLMASDDLKEFYEVADSSGGVIEFYPGAQKYQLKVIIEPKQKR